MELALVVARCELADCDRPLAPVAPGRPPRRFCSPEHRAKARARTRRGSTATSGPQPCVPPHQDAAPAPRLDADVRPGSVLAPLIGNRIISRSAPVIREVGDRRERLALPAGSAPDPAPRRVVAARPPVRAPLPGRAPSRRVVRRRRRPAWRPPARAARRSRRRRIVVVLGLLAVLVTGLCWVLFRDGAPAPRLPADDLPASDGRWIADAQVRVSDMDRVLGSITDAETAYRRSGAPGRPEPVERLAAAKTLLTQQRVLLQSQIDTLLQAAAVTGRLAEIDGQLAALTTVLDSAGTDPADSSADARTAVLEQRDLLLQRRDATLADLDRLRSAASAARSAPLPALDDTLPALVAEVTALAR